MAELYAPAALGNSCGEGSAVGVFLHNRFSLMHTGKYFDKEDLYRLRFRNYRLEK